MAPRTAILALGAFAIALLPSALAAAQPAPAATPSAPPATQPAPAAAQPAPAAAQPAPAAAPQDNVPVPQDNVPVLQADDLLRRGEALEQDGKPDEALEAYRAAWARRKSGAVAARLGTLELQRGEPVAAATHLAFALREVPPPGDPAALRARLDQARARVGELRVRAPSRFAVVWIDGVRAGPIAEGPLFAAPGARVVEVRAPGYHPARVPIDLAAGAARELDVPLVPSSALPPRLEPPPPEEPAAPPREGKSTAFIIGGLTSATMLALLGASLAAQGGDEQQTMGVVTLGAAGALALGAGVYALWPQPEAELAAAQPTRVRILAAAGHGGGALGLSGRF